MDANQSNRKFELRAEVIYASGSPDTYTASFDWLNTDWQYLALPIEIASSDSDGDKLPGTFPLKVGSPAREVTQINLYVDYSYNAGEIVLGNMSFREGAWKYSTFDENGRKTTDEDSSGKSKTTYYYDDKDRVVKSVVVDKQGRKFTSTCEYNKQGAQVRSINYAGVVEETVFDEKGRELKKIKYNLDDPTSKLYTESKRDDKGVVTADVDESGEYDSVTYTYDQNGEATVQIDGKGNKTAFGYKDGNMVSISGSSDGEESTNTMQYTADMLTKASNGDTDYNYTYDGWGRTVKVEIADEKYLDAAYEGQSKNVTTLASGDSITTETDEYDNVKQQTTTFANGIVETVLNKYDDLLNLKSTTVDTGDGKGYNIEYEYDKLVGKVSKEKRVVDEVSTDFKTYSYTPDGNLEKTEYKVGNQTLAYGYETDGTPDKRNSKVQLPFDVEQKFAYDGLGRTKEISLSENLVKDIYYAKYGDHATNRINSVWYGVNGIRKDNMRYTYDKAGNIETVTENGELVARYQYDGLNRLVREDNVHFGTFTYQYDAAGNILSKKSYGFTTAETLGKVTSVSEYSYKQSGWKDQLLSFNGERFAYDAMGNPTTYRNRTLSWQGRRLLSYSKDNKSANFTYDVNGIRTGKVIKNGEEIVSQTEYVNDGNNLIAEKRNNNWLYYIYGVDGVAGFCYNGATYLYRKNVQGDVTHIYKHELDSTLTLVAQYVYDAWGNCKTITDVDGIATLNPFRYRSYYFDEETGLYYLQTRYYDSELGRFISADSIEYLDTETLGGLNLYAYCNNNSVMYCDFSGEFPILATILGLIALVGMGLTIGGVATDNSTLKAVGLTMVAIPALISGGFAIAAGVGGATFLGIIGAGTMIAGVGSALFASAEIQQATGNGNWILDSGMSKELYNGLLLTTAAFATIGTISCGVLSSIGNLSSQSTMMKSLNNHPKRWKIVKQQIETATGKRYRGGISKYTNYINRWTGARLGTHEIVRNGFLIHGPHFHPWI